MGSDLPRRPLLVLQQVSIHAPAWGATSVEVVGFVQNRVSIHAPAWGATAAPWVTLAKLVVSIHAPAWGATKVHVALEAISGVSIHAPAWGATSRRFHISYSFRCFNSRSRMGSDPTTMRLISTGLPFQFTLPHGERHLTQISARIGARVSIHAPAWGATAKQVVLRRPHAGFNSRSRMGSDVTVTRKELPVSVSIHAPAWGATEETGLYSYALVVSIHAPAWGATRLVPRSSSSRTFQFTLPHGERPNASPSLRRITWFQFTLPHGERPRAGPPSPPPACFNSRSRMGSDLGFGGLGWALGLFQFTLPHGERRLRREDPATD